MSKNYSDFNIFDLTMRLLDLQKEATANHEHERFWRYAEAFDVVHEVWDQLYAEANPEESAKDKDIEITA